MLTEQAPLPGISAIRMVGDFMPDIALLDIGLPVMDGYELAQHLKQNPAPANTHLVALTGYGQQSDRERSRTAGFHAHLVKPIDMTALHALMKGWSPQTQLS